MKKIVILLIGIFLFSGIPVYTTFSANIDMKRARKLLQKKKSGETLSAKEREYLNKAMEERRKMRKQGKRIKQGKSREKMTGKTSVGLKPLNEMTASDKYKGEDGGLYGGGMNIFPREYQETVKKVTAKIQPLDSQGKPSKDGKIVLISIGMSNTTQEFLVFKRIADKDIRKSPFLAIVDGAQGGVDAHAWADPEGRYRKDKTGPWKELKNRLKRAGVTPEQVQVAWIKLALRGPAQIGEFPKHAKALQDNTVKILNRLKKTFFNLRIVYLSSRIYAGYATTKLNPEPYAYECAFSVRWLIQDQINGKPGLNYDSNKGKVNAPLVLWGPYLWADGTNSRRSDGLIWNRSDLAGDGTHPSNSGRRKVADMLLNFFKTDPNTKRWFTKKK